MENGKKMYITAESKRKCLIYQRIMLTRFIRGLNKKLKAKGYRTISDKGWKDVALPVLL